MKITNKRLMEIIRQEIQEFTSTGGTATTLKQMKSATKDIQTKKQLQRSKRTAYDIANKSYKTKVDTQKAKQTSYDRYDTVYNAKTKALNDFSNQKYRKAVKGGGFIYSKNPIKGGETNPDWTTKNTEKSNALRDRNTALLQKRTADTEKASAESDKESKERDYQLAGDNLTAAKKQALAMKAQTGFGFGAGGTAVGTGKASGTGKKGGKKDESLFRILGRDLMNEIKDIKKYS